MKGLPHFVQGLVTGCGDASRTLLPVLSYSCLGGSIYTQYYWDALFSCGTSFNFCLGKLVDNLCKCAFVFLVFHLDLYLDLSMHCGDTSTFLAFHSLDIGYISFLRGDHYLACGPSL